MALFSFCIHLRIPAAKQMIMRQALRKIVLTGGPGAGKTSIAHALLGEFRGRVTLVPEAATQVFRQLRVNWHRMNVQGRRDLQRRIYALQVEQEVRFARENPEKTLLLDRGTVDGAAYWPDGVEDYCEKMGTTLEAELGRYDGVIYLQTCAVLEVYDGDASNPFRHEDRAGAIRCDEAIARLWRQHPRFVAVMACREMGRKVQAVRETLRGWDVIPADR